MKDCIGTELVWFDAGRAGKILCRVRFIGKEYVSVAVMTATPEQVLLANLGVGEIANTLPSSLSEAKPPREPGEEGQG